MEQVGRGRRGGDDALPGAGQCGSGQACTRAGWKKGAGAEGHLVAGVLYLGAQRGPGCKTCWRCWVRPPRRIRARANPPLFVSAGAGPDARSFPVRARPEPGTCSPTYSKIVNDPYIGPHRHVPRAPGARSTRRTTQAVCGRGARRRSRSRPPGLLMMGREHGRGPRALACRATSGAHLQGFEEIVFDCVLHDSHDEEPDPDASRWSFPAGRMFGLAIEAACGAATRAHLRGCCTSLAAEDPNLADRARRGPRNETVPGRGLSELAPFDRCWERWAVQCTSWRSSTRPPPRIPYRETITAYAEGGMPANKKQTGGAGAVRGGSIRCGWSRSRGVAPASSSSIQVKGGVDSVPVHPRRRKRRVGR